MRVIPYCTILSSLAIVVNVISYMNSNVDYHAIFLNAFAYSVHMTRFYVGLAKTNRDKPGVHANQLRAARKHALDVREVWPTLRAAGFKLNHKKL